MRFINSIFNFLRFNRKNWKAVVLCLLAATIFWFFNALNKNYAANISFPLAFDFDRENYIPVQPMPNHIRLNVSGMGWDLFRKSSGLKVPPLVIPLERPADVRKIVGSTLPPLFAAQIEGLQINFVLTDTVFIEIDERTGKWAHLVLDADKFIRKGYGLSGPVHIQPDSIWLEGPKRIVSKIPGYVSLVLSEKNIDENYSNEIEIEFSSPLIFSNPPLTGVSFSVERLAEITTTVPLKVINVPQRLRNVIGIDEVTCTYQLPQSMLNAYSIDSVTAVLDLADIQSGQHKLVPSIRGIPQYARVHKVDTLSISF